MSKLFAETFPTLKLNSTVKAQLHEVEVTNITVNSTKDRLKIYLRSTHLLTRKDIAFLEQAIKNQLFAKARIQIIIMESYELSKQYTPENLMNLYIDSFLFDLEKESVVEKYAAGSQLSF